ncbi:MAG: S41 family peptidase, partial [Flavobacterium sp.]
MKKVILFLFLFFTKEIIAQSETSACVTLSKINALVKEFHYKPKPINDSLSAYLFKTFLKKLDTGNDLFLESEIDGLKKHKYKLDNYINDQDCNFLNDFYNSYTKAVNRHIALIETIKKEEFPLSSTEIIRFYRNSRPYSKTLSDLKRINKKRMLFDVLKEISESSKNKDSILKVFPNISKTFKQKIFDNYTCESAKYNLTEEEFYTKFFTVYCSYFDPHTEYFSSNTKSEFLSYLSADNYTFGLILTIKEKNNISIAEILPGSPAFFAEKIEDGDEVIKIKSNGEEYLINCFNFEKIEKTVSSSEVKSAYFTLRKKSGEVYTVNLTKQVMKDYQNSVYSYILERDNQKTGYIKIPSFYSTLEDGKTNVSDDVNKEIFKLKEDNISGLIIDLENNGGGSMEEAIKLCGLFMNTLYLGQERDNTNKKEIIGNQKAKNSYSGPTIILINGFSASASEFFTNAMQDYNLSVVVGTKSLGKATFQQILPLKEEKDQFVKVTMG